MKEITLISGKGGTGKTSVAAGLAHVGAPLLLCDADVDAANLHLIAAPQVRETHIFEGAWVAEIDPDKCSHCGLCIDYCRFDAIKETKNGNLKIQPYQCEGCRLCERICPSDAICSTRSTANQWFVSNTRFGTMVHAHMGPGEENSGKLVTQVRSKARELASSQGMEVLLTDGPPGTGCPVIASLTGTDHVLVVIEPSQSSLHDALRVIELAKSFKLPISAMINKWDLHEDSTTLIENKLIELNVPLLGKIPYDQSIVKSMIQGLAVTEFQPSGKLDPIIKKIWGQLIAM